MDWVTSILVPALILFLLGWRISDGVLVAKDANRQGMRGWAWGLLIFYSWWVGLLVYRHFRGPGPLRLKDDG